MRNARYYRAVFAVLAALVGASSLCLGTDRTVPRDYPTIQAAVDASRELDTILVAPGIYHESVIVDRRRGLVLRGDIDLDMTSGAVCWDVVAEYGLEVTLVGSIHIVGSQNITVENLTITGPGPGIRVEGTTLDRAADIAIRYCNLLCNENGAIELAGSYRRVAVSCTNACLSKGQNELLNTIDAVPHQADVHVTCNLSYGELEQAQRWVGWTSEVVVAVIDSGIDRTIPALSCRIWVNQDEIPDNGRDDDGNGYVDDIHGWDFVDNDPDSLTGSDMHWHGTFVAGVLADAIEPSTRLTQEPVNVKIMDLRFLDSESAFYTSDWPKLVDAIEYAVDNGARVINMSIYATRTPPQAVRQAIQRAVARGVLVVGIAGNDGGSLGPIASWEELFTVAALDREGSLAPFSNTGEAVDVGALGADVLSILPGGALVIESGTSFAAPWVAGVAALHISETPDIPLDTLEALLRATGSGP